MTWKNYQARIAEFFRRVPNARVRENLFVDGKSGTRQIDVQIFLPMQVKLGTVFTVNVDIHIIVDAKNHERPVSIGVIGQINDLRDDVGAHIAIIASPSGFTSAAKSRARQVNIVPLTVTSDLLAMLTQLEIPWAHSCHNYGCETGRGYVDWTPPSLETHAVMGTCSYCDVLHLLCPECGSVFPIHEFQEGKPLQCPGCECVYRAERDEYRKATYDVRNELDVMLMRAAYENASKRISSGRVSKIIGATKWQYMEEPIIVLTESELMEWSEDGEWLRLTEDGQRDYEAFVLAAEPADE